MSANIQGRSSNYLVLANPVIPGKKQAFARIQFDEEHAGFKFTERYPEAVHLKSAPDDDGDGKVSPPNPDNDWDNEDDWRWDYQQDDPKTAPSLKYNGAPINPNDPNEGVDGGFYPLSGTFTVQGHQYSGPLTLSMYRISYQGITGGYTGPDTSVIGPSAIQYGELNGSSGGKSLACRFYEGTSERAGFNTVHDLHGHCTVTDGGVPYTSPTHLSIRFVQDSDEDGKPPPCSFPDKTRGGGADVSELGAGDCRGTITDLDVSEDS